MELDRLKRVSFEVAKAIKEAGYPQELHEGTIFYTIDGFMDKYNSEKYELFDPMYCTAPTYIEVWFWLSDRLTHIDNRKVLSISLRTYKNKWWLSFNCGCSNDDGSDADYEFIRDTQEAAIIEAIEYLVANKLIKKYE